MVVMVIDCRVYLMGLDLHGIHKGIEPSINPKGKLITLDDSDRVDISQVYHCDGLLLCITKDFARLVVWNPYTGQTLWLTPGVRGPRLDLYIDYQFGVTRGSFIIDQEMKVAVVLDKERYVNDPTRNVAHIIGEDGYYREVDLGESTEKRKSPLGCSYVPSSVQIKQGGQKEEF
ncbi:unnamed protein product [Microthlaspi erraticum]|uniref:F-box associated beta-propeller type 1 domain-containing protein n=1 Tax=Microthlaspi erraticum TaxID=1685480 RepID=A0A6D2HHP6_9BRAS|nr:unnamed protein product [Microthlaspi erraticum]